MRPLLGDAATSLYTNATVFPVMTYAAVGIVNMLVSVISVPTSRSDTNIDTSRALLCTNVDSRQDHNSNGKQILSSKKNFDKSGPSAFGEKQAKRRERQKSFLKESGRVLLTTSAVLVYSLLVCFFVARRRQWKRQELIVEISCQRDERSLSSTTLPSHSFFVARVKTMVAGRWLDNETTSLCHV